MSEYILTRDCRCKGYVQVALLSLGHLCNDFYCNFLPILLPVLMLKFDLSLALSGVLVMIMSLTSNVLQPFLGYFMDKYNLNRMMPFLAFSGALFICTIGWSFNFYTLAICVALGGLASAGFHPMGAGLVGRAAPKGRKSSCMSLFIAGGNIGYAIAPILLAYFLSVYDEKCLLVFAVPSAVISLFIYISGVAKYRFVDAATAKKMHCNWRVIVGNRPLMMLNIAMGLRAWLYMGMTAFLPLWAISKGIGHIESGWVQAVFLIGAVAGGLAAGILNDKIGCKKVIFAALLINTIPTAAIFCISSLGYVHIFVYIALFFSGALVMAPSPGAIILT